METKNRMGMWEEQLTEIVRLLKIPVNLKITKRPGSWQFKRKIIFPNVFSDVNVTCCCSNRYFDCLQSTGKHKSVVFFLIITKLAVSRLFHFNYLKHYSTTTTFRQRARVTYTLLEDIVL